jgi:hypothetical protein
VTPEKRRNVQAKGSEPLKQYKTVIVKEVRGNVFGVEGDSSRLQVWCFGFVLKVVKFDAACFSCLLTTSPPSTRRCFSDV